MRELRFAWRAIRLNLRNSAELRSSFALSALGMALNNVSFIVIWVTFVRSVGNIGGWTAMDIVGLQGFNAMSFGIAFSFCAGFRRMGDVVASGAFDRFMLSPTNLLLRVGTSSFGVSAVGDILFGVVCLAIYCRTLPLEPVTWVAVPVLIASTTAVMAAAAIVAASAAFLFSEPRTAMNSFFELFLTPSLFHGGAFQGAMRFVFTFLVPSLLVGALPVEVLKQQSWGKLLMVSLISAAWLALSFVLFRKAVRRYESANFFTFGS